MTYDKYHDDFVTSWQSRWKAVSHEGADVYKGRVIDYGNREYTVLVGFLHKHDKFLAQCLEWLISWWPSLDPFEPSHACSEKGFSMKGDIRMKYKMENPNKIANLVQGNYKELTNLYLPRLLEL